MSNMSTRYIYRQHVFSQKINTKLTTTVHRKRIYLETSGSLYRLKNLVQTSLMQCL